MFKIKLFTFLMIIILLSSCKDNESAGQVQIKASEISEEVETTKLVEPIVQQKQENEQGLQTFPGEVSWKHFDDLVDFDNTEGKKYIVDVYTSWCGWCKVMDKQTFSDANFQEYISDKYHLVKFNAEQEEPIFFKGKKYEWQQGGRKGINALALELLNGRLSYPSLVFLDEDLNKIQVSAGFKKPDQLISELEKLQ